MRATRVQPMMGWYKMHNWLWEPEMTKRNKTAQVEDPIDAYMDQESAMMLWERVGDAIPDKHKMQMNECLLEVAERPTTKRKSSRTTMKKNLTKRLMKWKADMPTWWRTKIRWKWDLWRCKSHLRRWLEEWKQRSEENGVQMSRKKKNERLCNLKSHHCDETPTHGRRRREKGLLTILSDSYRCVTTWTELNIQMQEKMHHCRYGSQHWHYEEKWEHSSF